MTNKLYFLALNRMKGVGPRTIMMLLKRWPTLEDLFKLSPDSMKEAGLPDALINSINLFDLDEINADLAWEQADNHHLLTWEDKAYPSLLKEIHDPPPVLYAAGNLDCLNHLTLAMIGTRNPSHNGRETAWLFAKELAAYQLTIVSGLALGIDTAAHYGCLEAKGATIAVMGTGIDLTYPRANSKLANRIKDNGLLLTEFPLKTTPNAGHFPRRNRIISGLSLVTLVIEAAIKSGSLITARLALEQNREVLAIPDSIHNPQARGCHQLLQQGAKLVTSIQDVLDEFHLENNKPPASNVSISLANTDQSLVECVGFEMTSIDHIIERSGLTVDAVTCELALLEINGIIKAVPGGYTRCA